MAMTTAVRGPFRGITIRGLGAAQPTTASQQQIAQMVIDAANRYGVPPNLALGIASHESGFNPSATNVNTNGTTDWGVMQLNDTTVQTLGVSNPLDPQQNINAGVGLLAHYLQVYGGDQSKALWAYASGPGAVSSGNMNPTATQFISYVTGYDLGTTLPPTPLPPALAPDITGQPIDYASISSSSIDLTPPAPAQASAGEINWGVVGLMAGAVVLVMALS